VLEWSAVEALACKSTAVRSAPPAGVLDLRVGLKFDLRFRTDLSQFFGGLHISTFRKSVQNHYKTLLLGAEMLFSLGPRGALPPSPTSRMDGGIQKCFLLLE
jgi:hypothetical protein